MEKVVDNIEKMIEVYHNRERDVLKEYESFVFQPNKAEECRRAFYCYGSIR